MKHLILALLLSITSFCSNLTGPIPARNYLLGQFDPADFPELFVQVPSDRSSKKMYLRKEVLAAFNRMYQAAKKDNIKLNIISAFRSFSHQSAIWEKKYKEKYKAKVPDPKKRVLEILKYSSMPGTSRHHWGTDIDINSLENYYFAKGYGKKVYEWMKRNGPKYGFYLVYTQGRKSGYDTEKWHYTYLPLAKKMLDRYLIEVLPRDITGFSGDQYVEELYIVKRYVLGINPAIRPK